jgi:hypothetical protein
MVGSIMKSFFGWVRKKAVILFTYAVLVTALLAVYTYKQQSLIPGQNTFEQAAVQQLDGYKYPWRNSIDAPFTTLSKIVTFTGISSLHAVRITSAVMMVMSIVMFYQLLRNWLLSPGKALVGATLFATSSWALVLGRGGHSVVAGIFFLLLIFTLSTRLYFTTHPFLDWMLFIAAVSLSLYTPLMVWLVFLAFVVYMLNIRQKQRTVPLKTWHKVVAGCLGAILTLPLFISFFIDSSYILTLLGVDGLVISIPTLVLNAGTIVASIFFINTTSSPIGLGRLPFLDIFSLFMFLLGVYYFERRLSLKRSKLLFGGLAMGIIICSLSEFNVMRVSLLLPLVYIFVSAGVHESISRWLAVFPRNPIARTVGIVVLSAALGFTSFYHLTRTFIARPGNPETRSFYTIK